MAAATAQQPICAPAEPLLQGATLFHEYWWLNAASKGTWDCATVERDGTIVAWLPFVARTRFGLRFITMPPYTRTLGPLWPTLPVKSARQLSAQVELLQALLNEIPRYDRFELTLPPDSDLVLPFVACSYTVHHTFTHVWDGTPPASQLLQDMQDHTRRKIRSAGSKLFVQRHTDVDRFIRMSVRQRGEAGSSNIHRFDVVSAIFQACLHRKQTIVLSAVDGDGNDVAISVLVWGRGTLYYWLTARDPDRAGPAANSFLLWEALRFADELGVTFDADGVYSPHSVVFYSRFGLTPKVRPVVSHSSTWWRLAFMAKATLLPNSVDLYYRA